MIVRVRGCDTILRDVGYLEKLFRGTLRMSTRAKSDWTILRFL